MKVSAWTAKTSKCCKKTISGRRLGPEKSLRHWLVLPQGGRLYHCPEWYESRRGIPDAFRKWEQKARTLKKEWKWQRGIVTDPLIESQRNSGHFSLKNWESEKHKSWCFPAEGFKGHVVTARC